jgi:hypothetical protein
VNRYQRRKYGASRPARSGASPRHWQAYVLVLLVVLAVVYFRVFIHR